MNADDALQSLREQRKPSLNPFFAARVVHAARSQERRVPRAMILYWMLVLCFSASLLLPTRIGIPMAIAAIFIAVFPEKLAAWIAPLLRS